MKVTVFIAGVDLVGMMKTINRWSYVLPFIRSGTLQLFILRTCENLKADGRNNRCGMQVAQTVIVLMLAN
jgi:hypothetical protein